MTDCALVTASEVTAAVASADVAVGAPLEEGQQGIQT